MDAGFQGPQYKTAAVLSGFQPILYYLGQDHMDFNDMHERCAALSFALDTSPYTAVYAYTI